VVLLAALFVFTALSMRGTETGPVILVAHSQGTVIAAATLLQAKMDNEKYRC